MLSDGGYKPLAIEAQLFESRTGLLAKNWQQGTTKYEVKCAFSTLDLARGARDHLANLFKNCWELSWSQAAVRHRNAMKLTTLHRYPFCKLEAKGPLCLQKTPSLQLLFVMLVLSG